MLPIRLMGHRVAADRFSVTAQLAHTVTPVRYGKVEDRHPLRGHRLGGHPVGGHPLSDHEEYPGRYGRCSSSVVTTTRGGSAIYTLDESRELLPAAGWEELPVPDSKAPHSTQQFDSSGDTADMPTWDELVREHADRVYRLAYRLSGNSYDAEDLTQETFIRVFRSLNNYQPGTFEGWLHRITTNLFLDMVRRRSRIHMEALPDDYERVPGSRPSPEQEYADSRLDPDLQAALDSLAPEYRAAVVLCDIEGLSYEEIGATLGVKLGTVRSRIHRGRQAIRDYLAAHELIGPRGPIRVG